MTRVDDQLVHELAEWLRDTHKDAVSRLALAYPNDRETLHIPYNDLYLFDDEVAQNGLSNPDGLIEHLEQALPLVDIPIDIDLSGAHVRLTGLPQGRVHSVGTFNPDDVTGELIAIQGQVARRTPRDIMVSRAAFECQRCGTWTHIPQTNPNDRQEPHECAGCERKGPFRFEVTESDTTQFQEIRLQTPPEEAATTQTDTIDIRVMGDMVGKVNPGDRIRANVIVGADWKTKESAILEIHGNAHSIELLESSFDEIDTTEYKEAIDAFEDGDNSFEQVIKSIAPSHMGDTRIKEAIAYQLFGGVNSNLPDGSLKRGTIHLLLCGDPGCGKSKLLSYVNRIAPRSVKTTGKGTTNAGLTFAAVQDDFATGGRSLEAGALVQAHKGICAIDELDKMEPTDRDGVLECMSDQSVSRSVWGESRTLPAQTSILAAQNPSDGRFNQNDLPQYQIGLSNALISRFDLIFTLYDQPDEDYDSDLSKHLMDTAQAGQQAAAGQEITNDVVQPAIEPETFRAIIAKARTIQPVLTDESKEIIQDNYVNLRNANDNDGPVPVTPRDPLAVVRLSEAAARIDFSPTIEPRHVERVLGVRMACLADIGIDPETGEFDVDVIETGKSKSQRDRIRTIKDIIERLNEKDGATKDAILSKAKSHGISEDKTEHELKKLKDQGDLYCPNDKEYRVI